MKKALSLLLIGLLAALTPLPVRAADQAPSQEAVKKKSAARVIPFNGRIRAVDLSAQTITIGKRVFHCSAKTKLTRDNKSVSLSEEMVGQRVGGAYVKAEDGTLRAVTVRLKTPSGGEDGSGAKKSPQTSS